MRSVVVLALAWSLNAAPGQAQAPAPPPAAQPPAPTAPAPQPPAPPVRFLSFGTVESRKNQVEAMRAFARLRARRSDLDVRFDLVGLSRPFLLSGSRQANNMGPLVLVPRNASPRRVETLDLAAARRLCGQQVDWIEAT